MISTVYEGADNATPDKSGLENEVRCVAVENAGSRNTGTDLEGWKTRALTTREPIAEGGKGRTGQRENQLHGWKTHDFAGFKLECRKT